MANVGIFRVERVPLPMSARAEGDVCSAKRDEIPELFRVFEPPPASTGRGFWRKASASTGWTVVLLDGTGSQYAIPSYSAPSWAQALSLRMAAPAVAFWTMEGGWSYWVFDSGNEVVAQEHYTLPLPAVYGDVVRAGKLLGVDDSIFGRYEQAWRDERDEPSPETIRAHQRMGSCGLRSSSRTALPRPTRCWTAGDPIARGDLVGAV